MNLGLFTRYCVDTCSVIDLFGRKFPRDIYPTLWPMFELAASDGVIVSVREVYREIQARDDDVASWAKVHRGVFMDPDAAQRDALEGIVARHPECLDLLRRKAVLADPWVVAAAQAWGLTVVTSEGSRSPKKIPAVCDSEGVPCIGLFDMFRGLAWTFDTESGQA